jgi:CheY-like chemotaxis protein
MKKINLMEEKYHYILLVDDDDDDAFMLGQALKALGHGYDIQQVSNGSEALKNLLEMKITGKLPSLVVLDINMPEMDGRQTLLAIQKDEMLSKIPIVVLSNSSNAVDKLFFEKNNIEMIAKPFDLKTFYEVATSLLKYCKN